MGIPNLLQAANVNGALADALNLLSVEGLKASSRNGPVLCLDAPTIITYKKPFQRVLFSPLRDANPFFHLYESLWMLAGRCDAASLAVYAKQINAYADADGNLHGAYGRRWRSWFGGADQISLLIAHLAKFPDSRRAVLAMWDGKEDAACMGDSKDVPCNTHVYFRVYRGVLTMTVCNRSNDAIWGAFGANSVHMSFLQEYVAQSLGLEVGDYHQVTNNLHIYTERPDVHRLIDGMTVHYTPDDRYYPRRGVPATENMWLRGDFESPAWWLENFDRDIKMLTRSEIACFSVHLVNTFWCKHVAIPVLQAHAHYKAGRLDIALEAADKCASSDWRVACTEWLCRRAMVRSAP